MHANEMSKARLKTELGVYTHAQTHTLKYTLSYTLAHINRLTSSLAFSQTHLYILYCLAYVNTHMYALK